MIEVESSLLLHKTSCFLGFSCMLWLQLLSQVVAEGCCYIKTLVIPETRCHFEFCFLQKLDTLLACGRWGKMLWIYGNEQLEQTQVNQAQE